MRIIIIILILCSLATTCFKQETNFTGKYKIDKDKTNFGDAPKFILLLYIFVNQNNSHIIISNTQLDQRYKEQPPVVDTLSVDGSEFKGKTALGNISLTKLKWLNIQSFQVDIGFATVDGTFQ